MNSSPSAPLRSASFCWMTVVVEFESKVQNAILKIGAVTLHYVTFDDQSQEKVIHNFYKPKAGSLEFWLSPTGRLQVIFWQKRTECRAFRGDTETKRKFVSCCARSVCGVLQSRWEIDRDSTH